MQVDQPTHQCPRCGVGGKELVERVSTLKRLYWSECGGLSEGVCDIIEDSF